MRSFKNQTLISLNLLRTALVAGLVSSSGCTTMKTVLAVDPPAAEQEPIYSPFQGYTQDTGSSHDPYVVRSRKGDRSVEVQFPSTYGEASDFTVPVSPNFKDGDSHSKGYEYGARAPTSTDHEITSGLSQLGSPEEQARRSDIEQNLGVVESEGRNPAADRSYLAGLDVVKTLFKEGRFEAALLETDGMLKEFPTDPKLYEMRGTLFDRVGRLDLALQSWEQSLRLNPGNESLKRFLERKRQKRSLASP